MKELEEQRRKQVYYDYLEKQMNEKNMELQRLKEEKGYMFSQMQNRTKILSNHENYVKELKHKQ